MVLSVGSTDKTKKHIKINEKEKGMLLFLRRENLKVRCNRKIDRKQRKIKNCLGKIFITTWIVSAVIVSSLLVLQLNRINKTESRSEVFNHGFVSVTTPYHSEKVVGRAYINFNPHYVKSIQLKSKHGSLVQYDVTKYVGLFSGQLNVMLKAVMKNGKSIRLWAQDTFTVELTKKGNTVEYLQSEIYNLNKRNNPIAFTKEIVKNIKGKGGLFCIKIKFKCAGPTETYMYGTNTYPIGNQTRVTINQIFTMEIIKDNGHSCVLFSVHNNKNISATKSTHFDKLCIGYKNEYKNVYFIVNHNNPEQLLIGGGAEGAHAVFPKNTQAYLEIPSFIIKGKTVRLYYDLGVSNESTEYSNLKIAGINRYTGLVRLVPKGN